MSFTIEATYRELEPHFQERVRSNELLSHHSSLGVGGPADIWVSVGTRRELTTLVSLCGEKHWPLLIVGNCTNVVYADAGVRGIVARVALHTYTIEEQANGSAILTAEAGVSWPHLLQELAPKGWGGLEFGVGIPGTLGGGVISNAGAHNTDLGQVLEWIEVLDARGINSEAEDEISYPMPRRYQHKELDLTYRYSRFRERHEAYFDAQGSLVPAQRGVIEPAEIIMLVAIRLRREDPETLKAIITQHRQERRRTEPPERHTSSIFKDPPGDEAAKLVERVGLKGKVHGSAHISEYNTNYIVNDGGAKASDIAALIIEARRQVLEQTGVALELDAELRGEWSSPITGI